MKAKADEAEKSCALQIQELHEEATNIKHTLHEEHTKSLRLHRDNIELHRKLKIKSEELKVLEAQTGGFEAEMNRLTKAIHKVQGEVQTEVDAGGTDYEVLFRKQGEQQQRLHKAATAGAGEQLATAEHHKGKSSAHSKGTWKQHASRLDAAAASDAKADGGMEDDGSLAAVDSDDVATTSAATEDV